MGKKKYDVARNPAAGLSLDEGSSAKRQPFTTAELVQELNERRDGFAQAASNWFQRHKKKCGIDGKHTKVFHSFRHTFISTLLDDEVPEHAVAQVVGHEANLITGQVYWNAKDAAKRKPTIEKYQPQDQVWRLIPKYEEVTLVKHGNPNPQPQPVGMGETFHQCP
jgi:integrase